MRNTKQRLKNIHAFSKKRGNLKQRLEKEFLDHGIVTIPCKVSEFSDIISEYSVEGYESLNSEFVDYINDIVDLVPEEYPIVIAIVGKKFSQEEQQIIRNTIEDDFAYDLGIVEKENKQHIKTFLWMAVGIVITSIMLTVFNWWGTVPLELLFVFFWFFADTFVDYLLIEGRQLRKQRIKAARLACMKVVFSDKYTGQYYSEEEAEIILEGLYKETDKSN